RRKVASSAGSPTPSASSPPPTSEAAIVHRACCLGGRVDVWAPRCGVVHSVFAGAANLRLGEAWWTLLAADRPDQPSGIRLAPDAPGARDTPNARGARGATGLP